MVRLPRFAPLGIPQHIVQRGKNRQVCFASDEDMAAYSHWLCKRDYKRDYKGHAL
jgi:putative transposase